MEPLRDLEDGIDGVTHDFNNITSGNLHVINDLIKVTSGL